MNGVLEHKVDEVGVGLDELVQLLQVAQLASLLLVENVEVVLRRVQLHILHLRCQISFLLRDLFVALFELLFLFLQRADLFIDLLFHHLVEVLLLNLQLLHDAAEGLLEAVDLVVELLAHFEFQLGVELFAGGRLRLQHLHLVDHFLHHPLHFHHLGGAVDDFVLLLGVLKDAFGAEHVAVHHAVKLHFFLRVLRAVHDLGLRDGARLRLSAVLGRHRQPRQNLVVYRQVVRLYLVVALVVRALNHAVLGEFPDAF
mmetsp:Transcript_35519/g.43516  ORF Transcript_35519/g.43516 Transcript_35519/m.43516 type:complete len:256 (-) Transcript_35519:145-912(-)